jgi:uncharacterized sodium:solute symporter family permease YidK
MTSDRRTGMIFIQILYWSTNQNKTQKAIAALAVRECRPRNFILMVSLIVALLGVSLQAVWQVGATMLPDLMSSCLR